LGSIETPPSVAARIEFWRGLHERLDQLSNRLDAATRGKVMAAVHARVPPAMSAFAQAGHRPDFAE
jgi:N-formylglutamate amidohydrolase